MLFTTIADSRGPTRGWWVSFWLSVYNVINLGVDPSFLFMAHFYGSSIYYGVASETYNAGPESNGLDGTDA